MPILEIVELEVTKAPPDVYAMGTTVEVTIRNKIFLPWRYFLRVEYISGGSTVDSQVSTGTIMGKSERSVHSESSWSADLVKAWVGTTRLLIRGDVKEMDP